MGPGPQPPAGSGRSRGQECLTLSPAPPKPTLGLRLAQRQVLELRQLQALECLQLPAEGLEAWLLEAAEANPALQVSERPAPTRPAARHGAGTHGEWLEQLPDPHCGTLEGALQQLELLEAPAPLRAWAALLLRSLDGTGLLTRSDAELLAEGEALGLPDGLAWLGRAVALVQDLEPRGLGARDAREVLLLQLDPSDPDYRLLAELVEGHLEACAAGRRRSVAEALGVTLERLQELLQRLAMLRTRPLEGEGDSAPTLRPEVRVRLHAGDLVVDLVRGSLPEVRVDHDLEVLARDRAADRATRAWLRPRVDEARRILDAVRQRQETLLLVAAAAARHQGAWLRAEAPHLAPLTMRSLAEELGLATSTVSRAVAGKALDTPRGVLPLRSLFQAEAPTAGVARLDARARVGALIAAEDSTQPLSDDAIAAALGREGLDLARRTVAKYRRELGLASSFERREVCAPAAAAS